MAADVTYIAQPNQHGCAIACLAMVLGYTYDEMEAWLDEAGWTEDKRITGTSDTVYHEVLHRHGLGTIQLFKHDPLAGESRTLWPPMPFAPIHICCIELTNGYHHAVVLLENGRVLDPAKEACVAIEDPDFRQVVHITGIFSVLQPEIDNE